MHKVIVVLAAMFMALGVWSETLHMYHNEPKRTHEYREPVWHTVVDASVVNIKAIAYTHKRDIFDTTAVYLREEYTIPDAGNLPQALLSPIRTLLDSKRFLRSLNGPTINGSRTSVESVSVYVAEEGLQIHIQYLAATMENNPLQVYHSSTFNYILPSSSIR